jgi:hypothetical protein
VTYNDRECFRAETWVEPDADGETFALSAKLKPTSPASAKDDGGQPLGGVVALRSSTSVYRVDRTGGLKSVDIECALDVRLAAVLPVDCKLSGDVRNGQFHPHLRIAYPGGDLDEELDPVPLSREGSVLSPMHPVKRIAGLRPGQMWRMPLVDPLKKAFVALVRKRLPGLADDLLEDETVVSAHVLSQRRTLVWNNRPVECLVIEYTGKNVSAHTWVDAESGLVLRQEADSDEEHWAMQRE